MSDWDTQASVNTADPALLAAVKEYAQITGTLSKLQDRHSALADTIAAQFPIQSGEQAIDVDGMTVTCSRLERWKWDAEYLDDIFASSEILPDHIKKKLTVNKRLFQNLEDEEKKVLLPALTREPGPARVKVIEVSNV
jgi:hypothetical protein